MFTDRTEAGILLAEKLEKYKDVPGVVLAVPRGGVPIACIIAKELNLPLDLVLTKKIGHPFNKEYAIGAASLTDYFVLPHENVPGEYIQKELLVIRRRLKEMYRKFMGDKEPVDLKDKTVIVVDDGVATGNTLLATVRMLKRNNPRKIILAVPVASESAMEKLSPEVDEIVCLLVPEIFFGVGAFYEDFSEISDEEVIGYLAEFMEKDNTAMH